MTQILTVLACLAMVLKKRGPLADVAPQAAAKPEVLRRAAQIGAQSCQIGVLPPLRMLVRFFAGLGIGKPLDDEADALSLPARGGKDRRNAKPVCRPRSEARVSHLLPLEGYPGSSEVDRAVDGDHDRKP